jgi:hypothetical protein
MSMLLTVTVLTDPAAPPVSVTDPVEIVSAVCGVPELRVIVFSSVPTGASSADVG